MTEPCNAFHAGHGEQARRLDRCLILLTLVAIGLPAGRTAEAFEPKRKFPDTTATIGVYVDQLGDDLNRSQMRFAVEHYVGTQKALAGQIDLMRTQNPDFLMLHYRMGTREPDRSVVHVHRNRWATDWDEVNRHEDWFIHTTGAPKQRVYQFAGPVREYVMDLSGRYNGNTRNGWKEYWAKTVIEEAEACHADGVFADSTHPPYAVPAELANSPLGAPPYRDYIKHLEEFYDYVYKRLDEANLYFIPNVGSLTTTWDTTEGYYEDVHGAMVEFFGQRGNVHDWKLQQDRTLKLLGNGKIYIAQQRGMDPSRIDDRLWFLASYLLLKHNRSYINMFVNAPGLQGQLHWWPEYELKLGRPVIARVPKTVDEMRHGSGVYFREFQRGLVLVNPNPASRTVRLAGAQQYQRVTPWGGGIVDRSGHPPAGGLKLTPSPKEIELAPWSATILLKAADAATESRKGNLVHVNE
jgi:hypothetical protein